MNNPGKNKDRSKKEARDIRAEALKIANSQQVEGQTREQTRLIASGIQRGMEQFLRQQSEKARELDKRVKKVRRLAIQQSSELATDTTEIQRVAQVPIKKAWLPWGLLIISWMLFAGYVWFTRP
ncbi:DUF2956 domain-containing protein [Cellvibrio sp. ARAG 10.3]|uniref:DUF2956 domain-containing protein n=1 Tax=Cellvibrio sp. ARAG 10.3 TaxID=3451358 RepID=UPI003F4461F5